MISYGLFIDTLIKQNEYVKVKVMYERALAQGLKLNRLTCHNLITFFIDRGRLELAEKLLGVPSPSQLNPKLPSTLIP